LLSVDLNTIDWLEYQSPFLSSPQKI